VVDIVQTGVNLGKPFQNKDNCLPKCPWEIDPTITITCDSECPVQYPFAFYHGVYCCASNVDHQGNLLTGDSYGCQDAKFVRCGSSACQNNGNANSSNIQSDKLLNDFHGLKEDVFQLTEDVLNLTVSNQERDKTIEEIGITLQEMEKEQIILLHDIES